MVHIAPRNTKYFVIVAVVLWLFVIPPVVPIVAEAISEIFCNSVPDEMGETIKWDYWYGGVYVSCHLSSLARYIVLGHNSLFHQTTYNQRK